MIQHINMDPWKQSKHRWQRLRNNSDVFNIYRCHMSAQPLFGGKGHLNRYVNTCRHTGIIVCRVPTHNIPHMCKVSAAPLVISLSDSSQILGSGDMCEVQFVRSTALGSRQNQLLGLVERSKESRFDWDISGFILIIVDCTNRGYNKGDNGGSFHFIFTSFVCIKN